MIVKEIENLLAFFLLKLERDGLDGEKWKSVSDFQSNWTMADPNFGAMMEKSFRSLFDSNILSSRRKHAKSILHSFMEKDTARLKQMFFDLLYDRVSVKSRFEHFIMDCDDLFNTISRHIDFHYNQHHHDIETLSAYLTLAYPNKYVFYNFTAFDTFLSLVKAKEPADPNDLDRYFKTHRIIQSIIAKNPEVRKWLESDINFSVMEGQNLIFSQEFIAYAGRQ